MLRVGVDSYSYHRLLGEIRPGEDDPGERFAQGSLDAVRHCRELAFDAVSLETCFLDPPGALDHGRLREEAGPLELVLAWGHPDGLAFGEAPGALADLLQWIELAPRLPCRLVRMVVGSPRRRDDARIGEQIRRTVDPLRRAAEAAASVGVELAVENHADLRAAELGELLELAGEPVVGVCFDTANALRVGDDPLEAARLLAARVRMLHLKDCTAPDGSVTGPPSVPYGEGIVALDAVLDQLRGSDPLTCVELGQLGGGPVDERALVADGVRWLRARAASPGQSRCQTSG
jgi:sugar phosphate isomerase/epimerase